VKLQQKLTAQMFKPGNAAYHRKVEIYLGLNILPIIFAVPKTRGNTRENGENQPRSSKG
jgi:hypothetical protein